MDGKISLVLRLQCTYYFEINKSGIQCARAVVLSKHATHCSLPSVWRLKVNTSYAGGNILPMPHCIEDKPPVICVIKENDCKRGTDHAYNCFPLILCLYHIVFYFFYFSFSFVSDLLEDIIVHFLIIEWSILHIG